MLNIRKLDCYGQLIASCLTVISVIAMMGVGLLTGFLIIGCWQLISAALNTRSFIHLGFQQRILYYWIFSIADLLLLSLTYSLIASGTEAMTTIIAGITLTGAIAIVVYYWHIYFKLIGLLSLRNELDGLTKSKH